MFELLDAKTPEEAFCKLCELDIDNLSRGKMLQFLSILADLSLDLLDPDGLDVAEVWAQKLFGKKLSSELRSTLNYFSANIWANRRIIKSSQTNETSRESQWNWD
jgi:hypothetical protein